MDNIFMNKYGVLLVSLTFIFGCRAETADDCFQEPLYRDGYIYKYQFKVVEDNNVHNDSILRALATSEKDKYFLTYLDDKGKGIPNNCQL